MYIMKQLPLSLSLSLSLSAAFRDSLSRKSVLRRDPLISAGISKKHGYLVASVLYYVLTRPDTRGGERRGGGEEKRRAGRYQGKHAIKIASIEN